MNDANLEVTRHAKVAKLQKTRFGQEHVGRLYITVDDAVAMQILEGVHTLYKPRKDGLFGDWHLRFSGLLDLCKDIAVVGVLHDDDERLW